MTWRELQAFIKDIPEDKLDTKVGIIRQQWGISYETHCIEPTKKEVMRDKIQECIAYTCDKLNIEDEFAIVITTTEGE